MHRAAAFVACVALLTSLQPPAGVPSSGTLAPLSFHNRLLLNRAAVNGVARIDVMLLATGADSLHRVLAHAADHGGVVRRLEPELGYVRVDVPLDAALTVASHAAVAAWQVASFSRGAWYRDGPPAANAGMFRGFETAPPPAPRRSARHDALPPLTPGIAAAPGFTGDDDAGVRGWLERHPAYDGRGVTIAMLESAQPAFLDPTLGDVLTPDGQRVPKIAGIVSTVDDTMPDATRVRLSPPTETAAGWAQFHDLTWTVPGPGRYAFGTFRLPAGANLVHQFGVLRNASTGELRVDANGNRDFTDEAPVPDVGTRFEPGRLKILHPAPFDLAFVAASGRSADTVHIFTSQSGHTAMTVSVAAGARTREGLASGVAPNARVLLVRNVSGSSRFTGLVESYIEIAKRRDVDLLNASAATTMVPDVDGAFMGQLFARIVDVYDRPVVDAAGNHQLWLGSASARGPLLSVGGTMGPRAFAALYGGAELPSIVVHPSGAAGPALDGSIKPDFLAPMERLAADLPGSHVLDAVPVNAPAYRVPPGHQISCCTSASSPYAAGVLALLLSAAKQEGVRVNAASLSRALRFGARFLRGYPSHLQGNGVLDVEGAWRELRSPSAPPRITAAADVVHPLAQYAPSGGRGRGILEFGGWTAPAIGRRTLTLRRHGGAPGAAVYTVEWTGSDGAFTSDRTIALPLDTDVALPVRIDIPRPGAYSALFTLRDRETGRIAFRTQATVVAPVRLDAGAHRVRVTGRTPLLRTTAHYVDVPAGTDALAFELEVTRGIVRTSILPAHGLYPSYYHHLHPGITRPYPPGRYRITLPNPQPGVWSFYVTNDLLIHPVRPKDAAATAAEYALTVSAGRATLGARRDRGGIRVDVRNDGATVREPALDATPASLDTIRGVTRRDGLPALHTLDIAEGTAALALRLSSAPAAGLELFLYDCTSGPCFSHDLAFPPSSTQRITVRRPAAGRWVAAVHAAPRPAGQVAYTLERVLATGPSMRVTRQRALAPGSSWGARLPTRAGDLLVELIDLATEREAASRSWDPRPAVPPMSIQPVAWGRTLLKGRR